MLSAEKITFVFGEKREPISLWREGVGRFFFKGVVVSSLFDGERSRFPGVFGAIFLFLLLLRILESCHEKANLFFDGCG